MPYSFNTPKLLCALLADKITDGDYLDSYHHSKVVGNACALYNEHWLGHERTVVGDFGKDKSALAKQYQRASNSDNWLQTIHNRLNGSQLSAEEFCDNLWLRENLKPLDILKIDGCDARMLVGHALSYKTGDMVHVRYDDVANESEFILESAFPQGAVSHEPYIYGVNRQCGNASAGEGTTPTNPSTNNPAPQQLPQQQQ